LGSLELPPIVFFSRKLEFGLFRIPNLIEIIFTKLFEGTLPLYYNILGHFWVCTLICLWRLSGAFYVLFITEF
jgi:hypothetical protein